MKAGRKTLCTPALTKRLCKHISNACTVRSACEAEGILEKSFFEWLRKGDDGQVPYSAFSAAVMRAKGRFKARVCKSIIEDRDWRARLELISRIYPEEFGRIEPRIIIVQQPPAPMPATVNTFYRYIPEKASDGKCNGDDL
jgi:hypothetical protein